MCVLKLEKLQLVTVVREVDPKTPLATPLVTHNLRKELNLLMNSDIPHWTNQTEISKSRYIDESQKIILFWCEI